MTRHRRTVELGQLIEDKFLKYGVGNPDIPVDDIVVAYRAEYGVSLSTATVAVHRGLDAALRYLADESAWLSVPVTDFYFRRFVATHEKPQSDPDIRHSIAGLGRGQRRHGLHFCIGEDDLLFIEARIRGIVNGQGKIDANVRRVELAVEAKNLSPERVEQIATSVAAKTRGTVRRLKQAALAAGSSS